MKRPALVAAIVMLAVVAPAAAQAEPDLYGLTMTQHLVRFNDASPSVITADAPVTGLQPNEAAIGLTSSGLLSSDGRVYAVDLATGALSHFFNDPVGKAFTQPLSGSWFGFANGVSGWRTTSDTGQSLGYPNVTLGYQYYDPSYGAVPDVTALAVTRPAPGLPQTTYGIDVSKGTLVTFAAAVRGLHTVGPLGVPVSDPVTLAIADDGTAVMTTTAGSTSLLYSINLSSGAATPMGTMPAGTVVRGLAFVPPPQIVESPPGAWPFTLPINQDDANATVSFYRTGDPRPQVTFDWSTAELPPPTWVTFLDGSLVLLGDQPRAFAGRDFVASSGTVTFAPGQTVAYVPIHPIDDDDHATEALQIQFSNPTGGATVPPSYSVYINDYALEFDPATLTAPGDAPSANVSILRSSSGARSPASLAYSAAGGTATPGTDYQPVSGTLNLAAGQTAATFSIPLLKAARHDAGKTIGLSLTTTSDHSATARADEAVLTIGASEPSGSPAAAALPLSVTLRVNTTPRGVRIALTCSRACHGRAALTQARLDSNHHAHKHYLARATVHAPAKHLMTILLRLSRNERKLLTRDGSIATIRLSVQAANGSTAVASRTVRLQA